jgi:hypothetical protein
MFDLNFVGLEMFYVGDVWDNYLFRYRPHYALGTSIDFKWKNMGLLLLYIF